MLGMPCKFGSEVNTLSRSSMPAGLIFMGPTSLAGKSVVSLYLPDPPVRQFVSPFWPIVIDYLRLSS